MTTLDHPLLLSSILVPKPWGGDRLRTWRDADGTDGPLGESWDVADLAQDATPVDDPVSRVVQGPLAGSTLHELLERHPDQLLGAARRSAEGRFPLLVKLLDARRNLSLQVHPPRSLDPTRAKTESWVVLEADEGAELLLGVRPGVSLAEVTEAVGTAAMLELVAAVPARRGDVFHLPAGTIHALGAGLLVAEVQTPSDTTHRLWDWPDATSDGRELHVAAGLRDIGAGWQHNLGVEPVTADDGLLVTTDAYSLSRVTLTHDEPLSAGDGPARCRVALVLRGALAWDAHGRRDALPRGATAVLPAACTVAPRAAEDDTQVLVASPAS